MKGELFSFEDIKNLDSGTKVWCEFKNKGSNLYTIKKLFYGINFVNYISKSEWSSFFMDFSNLELDIKENIIQIYEWLSEEDYLQNKLILLREEIEMVLCANDKEKFLKLSKEYAELLHMGDLS